MAPAFDALVLNAGLRQSLSAIRSLGRSGLAVGAVGKAEGIPAFRSKWCRERFLAPTGEVGDGYMTFVDGLLQSAGARVLISSHDGTIDLLRRHRARVDARARLALAPEPALSVAIDKERTLDAARHLHVRIPRTLRVAGVGDVPAALQEIGLPAVMKPAHSWLANGSSSARLGAELATTVEEASRVVAGISRLGGITLMQGLLTGPREAVSLFYAKGEIHARFAQWAKRTQPPLGGESVLRQSIHVPGDIGLAAERLVREIGLEGYSEVEFRRDHLGQPYLMEINPRLSASVDIAVRCGVDFPRLLYQWAAGDRIDRIATYRVGRWMRHLEGDVMATIRALEQHGRPDVQPPLRALLAFGLTCVRPMSYDYVDWRDPLPGVKAMTNLARDLARRSVRVALRTAPFIGSGRVSPTGVRQPATRPSSTSCDVAVVGAGPYGLSAAAHLLGRGLRVAVFGKPLELWREHMPDGMLLRSHPWASSLSDPGHEWGFDRFARDASGQTTYPVPKDVFVEYGRWFQRHAVPHLDETYVTSVAQGPHGFALTLQDGRAVTAGAVVMAAGLKYYAHRPSAYEHLPASLVSHACDHNDLSRFEGKTVVVVGGGQSAIEYAALLREASACVHVVPRRPIAWRSPDRNGTRTTLERVLAPDASIAPGWQNWMLDRSPYLFYRLPQPYKDRRNGSYHSGASDWLRSRILGRVTLHEGQTVVASSARGGTVQVTLSGGRTLEADHVLLGTGYKVDLERLTMIDPSLRARIGTDDGTPVLSHYFESTVPGLYFVGMTSLRAFGPLFRFVAGCRASAERVAAAIGRAQ
jgi:cation diffusion facilitator CzcD-associated flavoprotein CzcO/predicted ATP-grasp superfamily ATP-dependent carboligase